MRIFNSFRNNQGKIAEFGAYVLFALMFRMVGYDWIASVAAPVGIALGLTITLNLDSRVAVRSASNVAFLVHVLIFGIVLLLITGTIIAGILASAYAIGLWPMPAMFLTK